MSDRMAQLESTSAILGEYMLRGYTLTALTCDTCSVTPLMRESAASAAREDRQPIQFCAQCDGRPDAGPSSSAQAVVDPEPSPLDDFYTQSDAGSSQPAAHAPQAPSQADRAAESISSLLLQGYSLLSSNCPNTACRGIPLVGYPKRKDGSKDGRRMCVSCGGAWVDEGDVGEMKMVEKRSADDMSAAITESPRSRARRELYATGNSIVEERVRAAQMPKQDEAREMDLDLDEEDGEEVQAPAPMPSTSSSISGPLSHASDALATTLDRLASSLERISPGSSDRANAFVNIKIHTEAMRDVLGVLELVKRMQ